MKKAALELAKVALFFATALVLGVAWMWYLDPLGWPVGVAHAQSPSNAYTQIGHKTTTLTLKKSSQTLLAADGKPGLSRGFCIDNMASGSVPVWFALTTAMVGVTPTTHAASSTDGGSRLLAAGNTYCDDSAEALTYTGAITIIAASTSGAPTVQGWRLP